ncbi:protease pro-enzyme activation domain-containing protein [Streptomyces turgidiscabies]|uniref:Peptidase families S8 and S53 n=1 Tax=Streptomyces turgidiscabies (strain Car8) TaxID=698760 RepID=L7F285_STRT8|nr:MULTISPECIES: S53 family peptidase [Streptomyces]ELP64710.1 peptidase families S8 and S53 [Streptomyces turgidiscabies Car8]MDX3491621.1 S53 family peptidase [Streptomyces turgidiscabies]GAQ73226.1 pseudomonalisin precursor [Streptomyces turgidiscabies]
MKSRLKLLGLVAAPVLLAAAVPTAYAANVAQPHATRAAVTGDVLKGLGRSATRTGKLAAGKRISVAISLAPRNDRALDTFVTKVSDPRSSSYGHYLTKGQFAARFGRTDAEVKQLKDYLRAQGLTVGKVHSGNLLVDASGTAAQLEKAFGTRLSTWKDASSGRSFYANDAAPTLPSAVAALVSDVAGLNNRTQLHHQSSSRVAPRNGPGGGYTPAQLKGGYNVSGTYTGSGQKIALLEFDGFQQANITKYDTNYSLGSPTPTVSKVDGGSGALGDGQVEVELDIEVLHAIAPKANVTVFEGPNSDAGEVDTYQAIVDSGIPTTSISWGASESARTTSNINAVDAVFKAGAAQGLGFYAASGDDGSDDAGDGTTTVDYPASDPYVTGVGGTKLTVTSANAFSKEVAWSGGGGGKSSVFKIPSWQTAVQKTAGGGFRQVPDVSAHANPSPGVSIYSQGSWGTVGGTSAAAPEWAAFAALYNQQAKAAGKANLGFANPALYTASGTGFHDITSGSNGAYSAATGWDFTTGWGSYNAATLASKLLG